MNIDRDELGLFRILGFRREDIATIAERLRLLDYCSLLPPHLQSAPSILDRLLASETIEWDNTSSQPNYPTTAASSTIPGGPSVSSQLTPIPPCSVPRTWEQSPCAGSFELPDTYAACSDSFRLGNTAFPASPPPSIADPLPLGPRGSGNAVCLISPPSTTTAASSPSPCDTVCPSTQHSHQTHPISQRELSRQAPSLRKTAQGRESPIIPRNSDDYNHGSVPPKKSKRKGGKTSSLQVDAILAELANANWNSLTYDVQGWVRTVGSVSPDDVAGPNGLSLSSVVSRCSRLQARDIRVNFLLMMDFIQLVTTCQSLRRRQGGVLSLAKIYRHELQCMPHRPALSTFVEWHAMGSKFAALAGGGSVYILILIAGLGLRVSIGSLPSDTPWALANILRAPTEARHRELIEKFIAPTIAHMKAALPITMDSHLRQMYPCQSLSDSDNFYDSFDLLKKLPARDASVWCPVMTHSPPSAIPLHQPTQEVVNSVAPPDADHLLPDLPHPCYDPPANQREEHENVGWAVSQRGFVMREPAMYSL